MNTVSLKIAKRLKEAGFDQSKTDYFLYQYVGSFSTDPPINSGDWELRPRKDEGRGIGRHVAAPTIDDLLKVLDCNISFIRNNARSWRVYDNDVPIGNMVEHINLVDALALLWLALKEKGTI